MPVYPPGYLNLGPGRAAAVRASDAERDFTVDLLCAAVGDGRLTLAELDQRVGAALSARTRAELATLIADLSGARLARPAGNPAQQPARPAALSPSRWTIIQSLIDRWAPPVAAGLG